MEIKTLSCNMGHHWDVDGTTEFGYWEPFNKEDWQCPECGLMSIDWEDK